MYLLRSFDISAHYLAASGNIAVDMAGDMDGRRVYQFMAYLHHLLSSSAFLEGYDVLSIPTHYPEDLELPAELAPMGEHFVVRGHMDAK
jgi:hypothetical protein